MSKQTIFCIFILLFGAGFCFGQAKMASGDSTSESSVRRFISDFASAFNHNDAAALERLTAPGYTFVTPVGAVQNQEQRLAPMKAGDLRYESVQYEDMDIRVFGNMAVVTARVIVKGKNKATDIGGQFRSTLALAKIKGQWKLAASQASAIAP